MRAIGWMAAAGLALAAAGAANADDVEARIKGVGYSRAHEACLEKARGDEVQVGACIDAELAREDKMLNQVYGELTAKADPKFRPQILKSERAWMAYRDAQCDLQYAEQASLKYGRQIYSACVLEMTHERVQALRDMVEDPNLHP